MSFAFTDLLTLGQVSRVLMQDVKRAPLSRTVRRGPGRGLAEGRGWGVSNQGWEVYPWRFGTLFQAQ